MPLARPAAALADDAPPHRREEAPRPLAPPRLPLPCRWPAPGALSPPRLLLAVPSTRSLLHWDASSCLVMAAALVEASRLALGCRLSSSRRLTAMEWKAREIGVR
ncbi:hypothetical protein PR202_ga20698 [Eleusine coracana subsp. coracana]|uniref:Uncharacterized protein n=1 Tax=Eleusine coracana subsp. coracana TaxID=191504 RepID=A0AAV5CYR3_ELECO|nr:hypothetical protein PR202_ga20698 [Eleusine coracana subsp. coracana]